MPRALQNDLKSGVVNVSVFPTKVVRNTSRYTPDWQVLSTTPPQIAATWTATTVTVAGGIQPGDNIAVVNGGQSFCHTVQAGDTLAAVSTALANQIRGATSAGAVITIPGAVELSAVVGGTGLMLQPVAEQVRNFQITVWSPNPTIRDSVGQIIAPLIASNPRLIMPDTTIARMWPLSDGDDEDGQQKEELYRRFFILSAEYLTTNLAPATQIVATTTTLTGGIVPNSPQSIETFAQ
jgi:hypothetical protein